MCLVVACSGAAPATTAREREVAPKPALVLRAPVDVLSALAKSIEQASWIAPGTAQLELGGPTFTAADGAPLIEVEVLDQQSNDVRVGVRLDHVRFAIWTPRARMLALLARDERIAGDSIGADPIGVVLARHARVRRLARDDGRTQIRYIGAVEVEGWIADDALVDHGPPGRKPATRAPTGARALMVLPGATIRAEPRWAGRALAVAHHAQFLDTVKIVDDAWVEVRYRDSEVEVHGFVSKREPPGRTHRRASYEPVAPPPPNATVPDRTCLYAGDEPIGYVVGDRAATVDATSRSERFLVTLDTPWGPLAFAARGRSATELSPCES